MNTNPIVDPIIGQRHKYFLQLWKSGAKVMTGVWCHESETPDWPVIVYDNPEKAFEMCMKLNRIARLVRSGALKPA